MDRQSHVSHSTHKVSLTRYAIITTVLWSLLIAYSLFWEHHQRQEKALSLARMQAKAFFEKDLLYRRWAARHGGVYVPVTEATQPNPYLAHIPERDITTASGRHLTMLNPAYMTRQIYELAQEYKGTGRGHITSLKALRPANAPDAWEKEALLAFERGESEVAQVERIDGKAYYRYMKSLFADKPCLKCHQSQGYREGDVRGGLSVSVEMEPFYAIVAKEMRGTYINHSLIWLLGLGTIGIGTRKLGRKTTSLYQKSVELELEISERKKAEEALQQSEEEYRKLSNEQQIILNATSVGIVFVRDRKVVWANPAFDVIFGYEVGATLNMETEHYYADKEVYERFGNKAYSVIAEGKIYSQDVMMKREDGSLFWCNLLGQAVSPGYLAKGSIWIVTDINSRKQAEEEKSKLEDQLLQSQKMEAIGQLAGGVAHDFNNMLGVIIGYAELALMKSEPSHPIYADLTEIRTAAERSAVLTRQLLAFARKQTIVPKVIDLNETIAGMLKMLQRLIGENIDLNLHTGASLWTVKVDPSQIDQILANLCVNARDAITDVGRVNIETGNCSFDSNYCATHTYVEPGEYVRLSVRDNGCGIGRETLAHIFEPFFTTKKVGEGTGLGLATVYGIVKQNDGFINVTSEPGQGATFTIYLPRHTGDNGEAQLEGVTEAIPRGSETILLVEDEPTILNMARMILELQGYTVLATDSASEAVRLAKKSADGIHLLMTDVVMPEINGRDLANNLQADNPKLKCLFMSGYPANVIAQHGMLDERVHFIQKPFSLPGLAAKVRDVLDGTSSSV